MSDVKIIVRNNRVIIQPTGWNTDIAEKVGDAVQRAEDAADTAEDALEQIEDIASGAPDAPSVINKANRDGSNLDAEQAESFRAAVGADITDVTRSETATLTIPPFVRSIRTTGYAARGDGGGAFYVRVASEPTHAGKVQSADGAWWELSEVAVSLAMFGGVACANLAQFSQQDRTGLPDALAAFDAFKGYFSARKAVGKLAYLDLDGFYNLTGKGLVDLDGLSIIGRGRNVCGLRFQGFGAQEPGLHVQALDAFVSDVWLWPDDVGGTDPGDRGHTGTGITVGDYITVADQPRASAVLRRLKISRITGSRVKHAMAFMGRCVGVDAEDIIIDGITGAGHNAAILTHWGGKGASVGSPLSETYHPHNVRVRNVVARGINGFGAISGSYDVHYEMIDQVGGAMLVIRPGDESDAWAVAEDVGNVHGSISVSNYRARGVTAAASITGRGTSKFTTDQTGGYRYYQPTYRSVRLDNWDVEGAPDRYLSLDFVNSESVEITNWTTRGAPSTGIAIFAQRCSGDIKISGSFSGACDLRDCRGMDTRGANFSAGTTATDTFAFRATGRLHTGVTLAIGASEAATQIELSAAMGYVIGRGDPIKVGTQTVYAADIYNNGCTTISVTPLPAAVSAGATITLDNLAHGHKYGGILDGGEYGRLLDGVPGFVDSGTRFRNFGFWGDVPRNCSGAVIGALFENGGVNRASSAGLNTACVYHGEGSYVSYFGCTYGLNSPYLNRSVRSHSDALGGAHFSAAVRDFVTSALNLAAPTYRAINVDGMIDAATGLPVSPATPKTWTPAVKIGAGSPTVSAPSPRIVEMAPDQVKVEISITITNKGSHTGNLTVEGFPFGVTESNSSAICRVTGATGLTGAVMATANSSGVFLIEQVGPTGVTPVTDANIVDGMNIRFGFVIRRG